MNLWKEYKDILHDTIELHNGVDSVWANWESKKTYLTAKTYTNPNIIKSREVEIWNETSWEKQRDDWLESIGNESTSSSDSLRSLSL